MRELSLAILLIAALLRYGDARPSYVNSIPNGNQIPNPCGTGNWPAVGHNSPNSGNGMNQFGRDFQAAGRRWTNDLCQKDSDGDGRTNGDELGDPDCQWTAGAAPSRTTDISHPGICDPVTSDECKAKNTFLSASNCAALNGGSSSGGSSGRPPRGPQRPTPPPDSDLPPAVTDPPPNLWIKKENCICYCFNESIFDDFQGMMGRFGGDQRSFGASSWGQGRPQPSRGGEQQDISRGRPGTRQQRGGSSQGGSNYGSWGQQDGMSSGYGGSLSRANMGGNMDGSWAGMRGGMMMPPGRPERFGGPGRGGNFMMPPLEESPEFSNTDDYTVSNHCMCACPKSS